MYYVLCSVMYVCIYMHIKMAQSSSSASSIADNERRLRRGDSRVGISPSDGVGVIVRDTCSTRSTCCSDCMSSDLHAHILDSNRLEIA